MMLCTRYLFFSNRDLSDDDAFLLGMDVILVMLTFSLDLNLQIKTVLVFPATNFKLINNK